MDSGIPPSEVVESTHGLVESTNGLPESPQGLHECVSSPFLVSESCLNLALFDHLRGQR